MIKKMYICIYVDFN